MNKTKIRLLGILTVILTVGTFFNIRNQYETLKIAELKNEELKIKIENLKQQKQRLVKQAEYATSSAFLEQQRRVLLGVGKENDAWLEIEGNENKIDLKTEINEAPEPTKLKEWIRWFTQ
jgi:hypothetical protein